MTKDGYYVILQPYDLLENGIEELKNAILERDMKKQLPADELNTSLIDFYCNDLPNVDGVKLSDIMAMSNNDLEKGHHWVQWAFPSDEVSKANTNAPLLDKEVIEKLKSDVTFDKKFGASADRFFDFLISCTYPDDNKPIWVTPRNHNYMRITRVIKSAKLFDRFDIAERFYSFGRDLYDKWPNDIGDETLAFWLNAYSDQMSKWLKLI